ncbi:hypothetical protein [Saliphagus sp. LR7]|uniref:hypothetical protein n=1 Tax=Saliphagus sp. LR7 TaxID=2282654 RepID=UPI000DF7EC2D|nr:hypothetical protein [Saliphagus sp. LR7]
MDWTLSRALAALIGGIVVTTATVAVVSGNPVASYVLNRNFALGTACMLIGVVLIWYQRPDPDEEPSS